MFLTVRNGPVGGRVHVVEPETLDFVENKKLKNENRANIWQTGNFFFLKKVLQLNSFEYLNFFLDTNDLDRDCCYFEVDCKSLKR